MLLMMPNTVAGISLKLRFKICLQRERERERLYNLLRISNTFILIQYTLCVIYANRVNCNTFRMHEETLLNINISDQMMYC